MLQNEALVAKIGVSPAENERRTSPLPRTSPGNRHRKAMRCPNCRQKWRASDASAAAERRAKRWQARAQRRRARLQGRAPALSVGGLLLHSRQLATNALELRRASQQLVACRGLRGGGLLLGSRQLLCSMRLHLCELIEDPACKAESETFSVSLSRIASAKLRAKHSQ